MAEMVRMRGCRSRSISGISRVMSTLVIVLIDGETLSWARPLRACDLACVLLDTPVPDCDSKHHAGV